MNGSGNLTFAMPDGATCKGQWSATSDLGVVPAGLISQYGSIYLSNYTISEESAQNPGVAADRCIISPNEPSSH